MKLPPLLYEDESCLVFDKPAGLAVQGGARVARSVDSLLKEHFADAGALRPLLVHRLDKESSGVLLVAKGGRNAAWYARLMTGESGPRPLKRYIAVCARDACAALLKAHGSIDEAVRVRGGAKSARTGYRLLAATSEHAVFELDLETGRFHQIRQHLQSLGYPILGDEKYGNWALNKELRRTHQLRRLLLHAARLRITTPANTTIDVRAPPPADFDPWLAGAKTED